MQTDLFTSGLRISELFFLLLYLCMEGICFMSANSSDTIVTHNLFWQPIGNMYIYSFYNFFTVLLAVVLLISMVSGYFE